MPSPIITTVIPTYRRPDLLRRAIRSVLDQTYPHFQVCVYDNASNDGTSEVVSALARRDSRVHYHCHPQNIGSQENFRFGVSHVDTPFFNLLSDDDFLLPEFFAQAMSALQKHPEAAFFFGGILSVDPDGRVIGASPFGKGQEQPCSPPELFRLLAPNTRTWTSILFRRSMLKALGGLKRETSYAADTDLILRAATRFRAVLSDAPCAVFTVHPASISVGHFSDAFESQLNLALFESVNEAIDSAQRDQILDLGDAVEMKELYRTLTAQNFFRNSFSLIARDRLSVAARTSELLAEVFHCNNMAAFVRLATLRNIFGALLRLAIKCTRAGRRVWFAKRAVRYDVYSTVVRQRISQLHDQPYSVASSIGTPVINRGAI